MWGDFVDSCKAGKDVRNGVSSDDKDTREAARSSKNDNAEVSCGSDEEQKVRQTRLRLYAILRLYGHVKLKRRY